MTFSEWLKLSVVKPQPLANNLEKTTSSLAGNQRWQKCLLWQCAFGNSTRRNCDPHSKWSVLSSPFGEVDHCRLPRFLPDHHRIGSKRKGSKFQGWLQGHTEQGGEVDGSRGVCLQVCGMWANEGTSRGLDSISQCTLQQRRRVLGQEGVYLPLKGSLF